MFKKVLFFSLLSLALPLNLLAQGDKKPVAEDDYAEAKIKQTVEIKVTENDFAYDDHPFKVFIVYQGQYGDLVKTDSSVFYTPGLSAPVNKFTDTISYNIIDLVNNLYSEFAHIYIEVTNEGSELLDINQVSCRINAYGMQFWSMDPEVLINYEVPKGLGISTIFNQTLWIGGLDESGELHLAAERYRQVGEDFFSGPIMDSTAYCNDQDVKYHKVWTVTSQEIAHHQLHWQDNGYEPVENIADWPGNGDVSLGQAPLLAPFHDLGSDGIYDPLQGDYPAVKGDKAIFVMNNDDRDAHTESGGRKMKVEIHTTYYAYAADHDSALKYTVFADQYIINRSDETYHDVYTGHFLDFDLGFFLDDYLHSDTTLESAVCYNGRAIDGQGGEGQYGEFPPAQSFTCLNYEMKGFIYFFSWDAPVFMQDPQTDLDYYNFLRSNWKNGIHLTYGGDGYGGEIPVNHIFTGDPVSGTGWTELESLAGPGDRRGLVSSGPYDFTPGDTIHLEFAFVFARDYNGNNLSSVALLKDRIRQVREFYINSPGIKDHDLTGIPVEIYPNPCHSELFVKYRDHSSGIVSAFIYDNTGKLVRQAEFSGYDLNKIDVRNLAPGFYLVRFQKDQVPTTLKFIKLSPNDY